MQNKAAKSSLALVCLLLALLLSGCSLLQLLDALNSDSPEESLFWAREHTEELFRCGEELLGHYPETPERNGADYRISASGGKLEALDLVSGERLVFESEDCTALLKRKQIRDVSLESDRVQYSLGGRGFGSQTDYFDVYYIPSDDLKGCFGYIDGMTFTEQDGGWFARGDGDNTFFYLELAEHLYFCSAHF